MAIAGVVAVAAAGSAYSARQQNKAQESAAAQQQEGVAQAQQYSQEAADTASGMLAPVAEYGLMNAPTIRGQADTMQAIGTRGIAGLEAQQGPLNVAQFLDPSMQFQLAQGQKAIEGSMAARGLSQSGAALQELTQFGQGLASQNYNQAVQQAMSNRNQQVGIADALASRGEVALNANQNLFSTGVNTLGQQANITAMQGTNAGNLAMTSANAGAAATASQRDVLGSAIQGGLGAFTAAKTGGLTSDENLKTLEVEVTDDEIEDFLNNLDPTSFEYTLEAEKKGAPEGRHTGVMAQDMEKSKVGKRLVKKDMDGDREVDVPMTVSALLATTATLNRRLKKLEGKK